MRINFTQYFHKLVLIIIFIALNQLFLVQIIGQAGGIAPGETLTTSPKNRSNTVTASVPDNAPPSAPFLISPEDEAKINDSTPDFIWQQSTDDVGIDYYELYIDGALAFGAIPTTSTSTSTYVLTYNSTSGQYILTPVNPLTDEHHTWYVAVFDTSGNSNTSAVWDFYLDTQAPSFIIQTIGPYSTNISAQDISSVPENPVELDDNQPIFSGSGEANATVHVTVQIPGEGNQDIDFTVAPDGTWNFQMGILPRDVIITLNFTITDESGNISVITGLKILIKQGFIIIPPTPTITPEIMPTPGVSPTPTIVPNPTTVPTPTIVPSPIIKIPVLPPEEIVEVIKDEIVDLIPVTILDTISTIPQEIRQVVQEVTSTIAPVGVIVATAAIPAISFLTLLLQFGQQFSWDIIMKILQALGLIPPQEPQGMVFDSQTNEPVSFALLTITSTTTETSDQIIETAVTDVDGIYQGIRLPIGKYNISVSHQDFNFPTKKSRPVYFSVEDFYRGEEFEVKSTRSQQLFLIPMDKISATQYKANFGKTVSAIIRKIRFTDLFWPLFIISVLITLFYPTWINKVLLLLYGVVLVKRLLHSFEKPAISGLVTTTDSQPVENAIIRVSDPYKGELVSIVNTNKQGYHESYLNPNRYQVQVTKSGLVWDKKGSQMSFEEVDVTQERKTLNAIMKDVTELYKELFGELPETK